MVDRHYIQYKYKERRCFIGSSTRQTLQLKKKGEFTLGHRITYGTLQVQIKDTFHCFIPLHIIQYIPATYEDEKGPRDELSRLPLMFVLVQYITHRPRPKRFCGTTVASTRADTGIGSSITTPAAASPPHPRSRRDVRERRGAAHSRGSPGFQYSGVGTRCLLGCGSCCGWNDAAMTHWAPEDAHVGREVDCGESTVFDHLLPSEDCLVDRYVVNGARWTQVGVVKRWMALGASGGGKVLLLLLIT